VALWLPRGPGAAATAGAYLAVTVALACCAPGRLAGGGRSSVVVREVAVATALVAPAVAGVALVAERAGFRLFGFDLDVPSLTVAHFHVAGFVAALVAGLLCRAAGDAAAARPAAPAVPVGTLVVLAGFFTGEWVELAGAAVLTAGMWLVAWLTWRQVRPRARGLPTRALLGAVAVTVVATTVLELSWAFGEAAGVPHPSVEWMTATHGVGNAVAFVACAVLAWRRLRVAPL
jgi:hypothetical protein